MPMSLTDLFRYLGAPLANTRWSWGAVRPSDGAVFLRVWQDEVDVRADKSRWVQVADVATIEGHERNLGLSERFRHLELIGGGAPSFMIMCVAVDPSAVPRTIKSSDDRRLYVGGALELSRGKHWLARSMTRSVEEVRAIPR